MPAGIRNSQKPE